MRSWLLAIMTVIGLGSPGIAQDVVRNPNRPLAAGAGRVIALQKTWSIKDTGDGYFLTNPMGLAVGPDGSVFVVDVNKILRFDATGRFVRAYKPSSVSDPFLFQGADIAGDTLVTFQRVGQRAYLFDLKTGAERTIDVPGGGRPMVQFLFCRNNRLYFSDPEKIFSYSLDGKKDGPDIPLPTDQTEWSEGPTARFVTASVRVAPLGDTEAVLCSSFDYLVRRIELTSGRVVKAFRREYERVKNQSPTSPQLYKLDIGGLLPIGDRLWVFTSTSDATRGTLVDVFDRDGRYVDSFFLQAKDGDSAVPLSFAPKAASGRDLVIGHRKGTGFTIAKYTLPAGS